MKTIFILLALYLAYVVLKGLFFRSSFRTRPPGARPRVDEAERAAGHGPGEDDSEATVEDPVCGSYVPVSAAESIVTGHGRVYFCSPECREKYESSGS